MRFTVGMPWSISKTQSGWVSGDFLLEVPHHKSRRVLSFSVTLLQKYGFLYIRDYG